MGPLISPDTGLMGYPTYADRGVEISVLYSAGFVQFGQAFTLQSSLKLGIETWFIYSLEIDIGCNDPEGDNPWAFHIGATSVAF